nr:MAG TPA: YonK protein [Caudoviricetes sp.]
MIFKEGKTLEIKVSRVKETDNGIIIEELDKDGYGLETFSLEDLFSNFIGEDKVKIKIENVNER